jgi:creatinine amidohydrolase
VAIVTDVAGSLRRQGVSGLLVINGHGGNYVLANAVQEANLGPPPRLGLYPARDDWNEARQASGMVSEPHDDMHAGELETSILLAAFPDLVREGWDQADHAQTDRRHLLTLGMAAYTKTGVIGFPSRATADKGRAALQRLAEGAKKIINILEDASTDG